MKFLSNKFDCHSPRHKVFDLYVVVYNNNGAVEIGGKFRP